MSHPHPICNSELEDNSHPTSKCEGQRHFRNNGAIVAALEVFLNAVLGMQANAGFKFTIINAYDAINPRLLFLEDNEVKLLSYLRRN